MKKVHMNYLLDAVIALAFLMSAFSGVAFIFMGDGGYQGGRNPGFATAFLSIPRTTWSDLHLLTSLVMITGVVVHLILHWKWIVCVTRQMLPAKQIQSTEACKVTV
jgi:hypothetical protein